jgi:hypothetical protein
MDSLLLALLATLTPAIAWEQVMHDCLGAVESQPVTYRVLLATGNMAHGATCPRTETGAQQECATWAWREVEVGTATALWWEDLDVPDPPVGMVYAAAGVVAVDPSGNRSDGPCTPLGG